MRLIVDQADLDQEIQQGQPVMVLFGVLSDRLFIEQNNRMLQIEEDFGIWYCVVDVQLLPEIKAHYNVNGKPVMVAFNQGEQIVHLVGRHTPLSIVRSLKRKGALLQQAPDPQS